MADLIIIKGPLHPDLFGGDTHRMVAVDEEVLQQSLDSVDACLYAYQIPHLGPELSDYALDTYLNFTGGHL